MGKKILIIRGWRSKKEHWNKVIEELEKNDFEVLSPDLPGFTESFPVKKPWRIDDYADWLLNYIEKREWEEFNVLGHSFGGAIALKLARKKSKGVKKLILVSPAIFGVKSPKTIIFYIIAKIISPFISLPFLKRKSTEIKKKLSFFGIKEYYFEKGVMGKTLRSLSKENFKEDLKNTPQKTLIIWGEGDRSISVKNAKKIKKFLKNSKIIIFQKGGHHIHLEMPDKFSKAIIKFLK